VSRQEVHLAGAKPVLQEQVPEESQEEDKLPVKSQLQGEQETPKYPLRHVLHLSPVNPVAQVHLPEESQS